MKEIINKILSNSLLSDSLKLATSHFLMLFLPLVVTPILSRLYAPETFGEWGVFAGSFYIISVILFLCYEYTIIKVDEPEFPASVVLNFIVSIAIIILTVIFFTLGKAIGIPFFTKFQYPYLLYIFLLLTSIAKICGSIANRREMYWVMSAESLLSGIGQAVFRIIFGVFIITANGLIMGTILSQVVCILVYISLIHRVFTKEFFKSVTTKAVKNVAIANKKFPLYDAPSTLLSYAALNLPIIILSFYFTMSDIGCFSVVVQLLLLPMSLIGSAIGKVYYRQISEENISEDTIIRISKQVLKVTVTIAIIPTLFLACGADKLVTIFLGSKWTTAAGVSLCLSIWSIPTILTQPLLPIFRRRDLQDSMFKYDIIYFILGIGFLLLSCIFNMNLYQCLIIYAIGCFIAKSLLFRQILKLTRVPFRSVFEKLNIIVYTICFLILTVRLFNLF